MSITNKYFLFIVKVLLFFVLILLLRYQLVSKNVSYEGFKEIFRTNNLNYLFLFFAITLMPINWFLETYKWKLLVNVIQKKFSTFDSLKSVLIGLFFGFITPNRIGEFGGRLINISKGNKISALNLSFLGGISQFVITFLIGLSSAFYYYKPNFHSPISIFFLLIIIYAITIFIFFNLNRFTIYILSFNFFERISNNLNIKFSTNNLFLSKILLLTLIRYSIYVLQYILFIYFFNIDLNFFFLFSIISIMLFIQTVIPTWSFIDIGVRGNILLFLLSKYVDNQLFIIMVILLVWILNLVIPAIVGYIYFLTFKMEVNYEKFNSNNNSSNI